MAFYKDCASLEQVFRSIKDTAKLKLLYFAEISKNKMPDFAENQAFTSFYFLFLWSCRESNPGPNEKQRCFLHVYSAIDCRDQIREQTPKSNPYLLNFARPPELRVNYSGIFRYPLAEAEPDGPIEGYLVPMPSTRIKLNLLDSIKQQEHNYLRLVIVCEKV